MVDADKPAFLAVLNTLTAVKPGGKLTREALEVWWKTFADWSIEEFQAAGAELVRTSEFMPNPYHFAQIRKAARLAPGEAWAQVLAHIRGRAPAPTDPIVLAAVNALGGFTALGMTKSDDLPFRERRFAEHYETIGDAEATREAVPQLAGSPKHLALESLLKSKRLT